MGFSTYINENTLLTEGIEDRGLFKAVFLAGTPGSGKSHVISKIKSGSIEPRVVNVDKFVEHLNRDNKSGTFFRAGVYDKAKQLSKNQFAQYLNGALPLFIDATSANMDTLRGRLNTLDTIGYDYAMVFVNTSVETAQKRVNMRARKVDPEVIKYDYEVIQKLKNKIKEYFPFHMEINNDDGELTDDIILKAYKRISYFYEAEIENPIGKERYDMMREKGWKYLSPNIIDISEIKRLINGWYND